MKNTIFFDFDGTLIDCEKFQTNRLKAILQNHNVDTSSINFRDLIGPPLANTFSYYIKDQNVDDVLKEYNNTFDPKLLDGVYLYDGIIDLLKDLKKIGYKICVVSLQFKDIVEAELKYLKIESLIDEIYCDSQKTAYSSKADLVEDVLLSQNIKKEDIVFVGDTSNDVMAGKNNDIVSVMVGWGFGKTTDEADYVAENTMQLYSILKSLKNGA